MLFMILQAANLTTTPDPATFLYIGDMKRGVFTQPFTLAQEGMAALFVMKEKNSKGVFSNYTGVLRIVISLKKQFYLHSTKPKQHEKNITNF
jgi:hypothetical protein